MTIVIIILAVLFVFIGVLWINTPSKKHKPEKGTPPKQKYEGIF